MDKAQTDIPLGDIPNQEKKSRNMDYGHADSPDNDIHLSDILKPSTLIMGIIVLVLVVLVGWYILVLKPALNDNESMIHFMPPAEQLASSEAEKPLAIAPNETVVKTPPVPASTSTPVTAPTAQENKAAEGAVGSATPTPQPADKQTKTIKTATNKSISGHHQKSHTGKREQEKRVGHAAHHPTLNEEQKCTAAQIAMQQCATYR